MKRPLRPSFYDFLGLWEKSRAERLKPGMQQWQKKIKADPFLLKPEQLAALRAADFPLFARDAFWIDRYLELFAFTKEHGHAFVPINKNRGPLATWISTQRTHRMEGKLTPSRQRLLDQLKFVWDPHEVVWKDRMTALTRFIQTHGHMRIPQDKTYGQLAAWVVSCRMRKEKLSPKRRRELEQVGFVWNPYETAWQNGLEELKKFVMYHGHGNVPIRSPVHPRRRALSFLGEGSTTRGNWMRSGEASSNRLGWS
jgi:Helicase associated domain